MDKLVLKTNQKLLSLFIHSAHPWNLVIGITTYILGAGIVDYFGMPIDHNSFGVGLAWVEMVLVSCNFLKTYFDYHEEVQEIPDEDDNEIKIPIIRIRRAFLQASVTTMTITAVLSVLLFNRKSFSPAALLILGLIFLLAFFYAVPPTRLVYRGYGELSEAIILANLIPAFAYLLQTGELHSVLAKLTFPLTALCLAGILSIKMPDLNNDLKLGRNTFNVRLGCQNSINIHNLLILIGYLLLAGNLIQGLPWSLTWPGLLTFPLGLFQIRQLIRITRGEKPRWTLMKLNSYALILLTAYFLAFSLWTA